jgi:hypothetical protein
MPGVLETSQRGVKFTIYKENGRAPSVFIPGATISDPLCQQILKEFAKEQSPSDSPELAHCNHNDHSQDSGNISLKL